MRTLKAILAYDGSDRGAGVRFKESSNVSVRRLRASRFLSLLLVELMPEFML